MNRRGRRQQAGATEPTAGAFCVLDRGSSGDQCEPRKSQWEEAAPLLTQRLSVAPLVTQHLCVALPVTQHVYVTPSLTQHFSKALSVIYDFCGCCHCAVDRASGLEMDSCGCRQSANAPCSAPHYALCCSSACNALVPYQAARHRVWELFV